MKVRKKRLYFSCRTVHVQIKTLLQCILCYWLVDVIIFKRIQCRFHNMCYITVRFLVLMTKKISYKKINCIPCICCTEEWRCKKNICFKTLKLHDSKTCLQRGSFSSIYSSSHLYCDFIFNSSFLAYSQNLKYMTWTSSHIVLYTRTCMCLCTVCRVLIRFSNVYVFRCYHISSIIIFIKEHNTTFALY